MKHLVASVAALAVAAVVGVSAATAAKPAGRITISISRPSVVYGGTVTLSGVVSSQAADEQIVVLARQFGDATFLPVATVVTTSGGAWTYTASPTIQTAYEVQWLAATSRSVGVKVSPALTLTQVSLSGGRGTFTVGAKGDRTFVGKFVLVQRLTSAGQVQLKKVVLGPSSTATFTIRVQRGISRLRAVMPTSQTQPGYVGGQSATVTIRS